MGDSTSLALTNIPVVDFSGFLQGNSAIRQQTIQTIFQACHQVGFLYLKNHGIPLKAIDQAFDQSRIFFDLPLTAKQQLAWSSEYTNLGYIGLERECLDEAKPGDLKEAFNIGSESLTAATVHPSTNLWPTEQPLFRQTMNDFFELCSTATEQIFRAFACALSMPADYLVQHHQTQNYTLRLLHYPPLTAAPRAGQLRAGAHSDYGSLTLLFQDNVGGLEVQTAQGDWIAAPTIANTVLINTGDLMQQWSNNIFRSTKHRVKLPNSAQSNRYSIAFFCQPDADADIVCLPTCHSQQNPPKYAPVKSGDYLLSRLRATY
ncbi:2og-fe oxygenase [Leptolyngbya sp. Heron Island J]|uniref:isopenicillin N synthase family dioxygenase n=1 Tax=Leptolyngbya sp. Heron Island J TaxID=1385935 RepID=UPI0003B9AA61|nr:2-oxoglutarate and iron-dependent oxygenase domain-containing protein [Leptolyngbya sp. Heron Island J]ESA33987.1 2og-fe oxygenase [Leptolyngbya sp. Heron Island J]